MGLTCPCCSTEMVPGRAYSKHKTWALINWGPAAKDLCFSAQDTNDQSIVLKSRESCDAHRCPKCRAVLIQPGSRLTTL